MQNSLEFSTIPQRIRIARLRKGISRRELASRLKVDVTAVIAWETGKYLPRDVNRAALARHLGLDLFSLFAISPPDDDPETSSANLLTSTQASRETFTDLARKCQRQIKILRLSYPFSTSTNHLREYRDVLSRRILNDEIDIRIVEVFYNLNRLQEVLANAYLYEGHAYSVKTFNVSSRSVFPGIDVYIFDDTNIVLASYWMIEALDERPQLQVRGKPFQIFLMEYWNDVWRHAASMTPNGLNDLSVFRELAADLGQSESEWDHFHSRARRYKPEDGIPTLP